MLTLTATSIFAWNHISALTRYSWRHWLRTLYPWLFYLLNPRAGILIIKYVTRVKEVIGLMPSCPWKQMSLVRVGRPQQHKVKRPVRPKKAAAAPRRDWVVSPDICSTCCVPVIWLSQLHYAASDRIIYGVTRQLRASSTRVCCKVIFLSKLSDVRPLLMVSEHCQWPVCAQGVTCGAGKLLAWRSDACCFITLCMWTSL